MFTTQVYSRATKNKFVFFVASLLGSSQCNLNPHKHWVAELKSLRQDMPKPAI
jgi:hypothetical protein